MCVVDVVGVREEMREERREKREEEMNGGCGMLALNRLTPIYILQYPYSSCSRWCIEVSHGYLASNGMKQPITKAFKKDIS